MELITCLWTENHLLRVSDPRSMDLAISTGRVMRRRQDCDREFRLPSPVLWSGARCSRQTGWSGAGGMHLKEQWTVDKASSILCEPRRLGVSAVSRTSKAASRRDAETQRFAGRCALLDRLKADLYDNWSPVSSRSIPCRPGPHRSVSTKDYRSNHQTPAETGNAVVAFITPQLRARRHRGRATAGRNRMD